MAGERSFDTDFSRFAIADFAEHDDIGIGAQKARMARQN
jgi:hypothetical protein